MNEEKDGSHLVDQNSLAMMEKIQGSPVYQASLKDEEPKVPERSAMDRLKQLMPTMPHGINIASGLLSLAFPGETGELVKNLPQAMTGQQPSPSTKIENFIGESLPGLEAAPGAKAGAKLAGETAEYLRPGKAAKEFIQDIGGGKTAEENAEELAKRIHVSHEANKAEALSHKAEVIEKVGDKKHAIASDYFKNLPAQDYMTGNLKKLNEQFISDRTFKSADEFQAQLGNEIGKLSRQSKKGTLDQAGLHKLDALVEARDMINSQQDKILSRYKGLKDKYDMFRTKWRENVVPYHSDQTLAEISKYGKNQGITPSWIKSQFAHPDVEVQKIIGDIGSKGKSNVLYNELIKEGQSPEAASLAQSIMDMHHMGGYQKYLDPKMLKFADELAQRAATSGKVVKAGKLVGGGALSAAGHPYMGTLLALSALPTKTIFKKIAEKI